jgi:pyruvate dehydrogenase E2 component (dihydrolipoamide acetyltransferase)
VAEFRMPSLGADMERGTVVEWRVAPGDHVRRGDVVAVVDTDKSAIEVEVFEEGIVEEILVAVGTEVPVGTPLARIGTTAPATTMPAPPPAPAVAPPTPAVPPPVVSPLVPVPAAAMAPAAAGTGIGIVASPVVRHLAEHLEVDARRIAGTAPGGRVTRADVERAASRQRTRVPSSPYARRLAARWGTDLASLTGTGPGGAIRASDVERAGPPSELEPARPVAPVTAPADRRPGMRRAIAGLMTRSWREIPHYHLSTTIDMGRAMEWLAEANAGRPPAQRLLAAALLLKATARAAVDVPGLNGFWSDGEFRPAEAVHLGVAISLRGGGLVAPAIHDCDRLPLDELMAGLKDLTARARKGVLRSGEMADPTMTVTNLGDQGAEAVFGVIYPPQVALVGFGRIVERPVARDGLLGIRPVVTATLAADHRASDGHLGGLLLAAIDRQLQHPEAL